MFGLFKKKEAGVTIIDKVVIDEKAKLQLLFSQWNNDKNIAFIFWFDESVQEAESFFATLTNEPITILTAREAATPQLAGKTPVFAEHYPLRSKEKELYAKLGLSTVYVFSSLREPLFQKFGGDKIVELMQKLGMKDDEIIEHKMISKAVQQAQEKIEKKITFEQGASSQADWMKKNLPT